MQGYRIFQEGEQYHLVSVLYSSCDKTDVLNRLDLLTHKTRPVSSVKRQKTNERHSYITAPPPRSWE